ncbi:MAG: TonB-dependent receptor [Mangrovibacterium sp.]
MKKKQTNEVWNNHILTKTLQIMRLTLGLFLMLVAQGWATSAYSQKAVLNLNMKNVKIIDVLEAIENQTDYFFLFNYEQISSDQRISVNLSNAKIEEILDSILKGTGLKYTMTGRQIVIAKNEPAQPDHFYPDTSQQQKKISGRVTGADKKPVPGATILVKGTTTGTITDPEGNYTLPNVPADGTLVFSFVGMKTQEIPVAGKSIIHVVLEEETVDLGEVVAVGYGTMKKANLTGSVSSVSSRELMERPATNATGLLQGRVSGLHVTQPSGQPGRDDAIFYIRGLGSFGAASTPLILIDGVIGTLSDLAPNDIENISVLKDAASASIYGARAANGVILVTTKHAKKGARIEYKIDVGVHEATRLPEGITNSAEYMEMSNKAYSRSGLVPLYKQEQIDAYAHATNDPQYPNFDWVDYYFSPATVINHYLSLSNVTEKNSYKLSLNYLDQDGILPNIKHKRYNAQLNFTSQITKRITLGANIRAVFKDNHEPPYWDLSSVRHIFQMNPLYMPYLPDGSNRKTAWAYPNEGHDAISPVAFSNGSKEYKDYGANAKAFIKVDLFKGLTWEFDANIDYQTIFTKSHIYTTQEHYFYHKLAGEEDYSLNPAVTAPVGSALTDYYYISTIPTIYSTLNYDTRIGSSHTLKAMLGFEQQSLDYRYLTGSKEKFPTKDLKELSAGDNDGQMVTGSSGGWAIRSYFGRLGYDYKGKYLIEANARYDGTSRVAKANRWGFFPSVSAGWRISEEKLLKDQFTWLSNLKLRASYGVLGNQEIGNYPYQDILSLTIYPYGDDLNQGVVISRLTDKNLKWESTKVTDIGLDLDICNGLFGMTFDWFKKNTFDILASQPVPGSLGLSGPVTNNGKLQNTGWEMELRHGKQIGEFTYSVNFMVSTYKNKLLSIVTPTKGVNEVGLPYGSIYLYEMEGIFQSNDDIANSADHIFYTPKPGDIKIKNQNGDEVIDAEDRISISPYPDFTYSFGFNLGWKNLTVTAFFQGVEGIRNMVYGWGSDPFVQSGFLPARFRDAWSETNPTNKIPALYKGEGWISGYPGVYAYPSTYFLQDASYLRLKTCKIAYDLPKSFVNKMKLQGLTVYISGDNLLTFTNYTGFDPERAGGGSAAVYPQVRIINAGINLEL